MSFDITTVQHRRRSRSFLDLSRCLKLRGFQVLGHDGLPAKVRSFVDEEDFTVRSPHTRPVSRISTRVAVTLPCMAPATEMLLALISARTLALSVMTRFPSLRSSLDDTVDAQAAISLDVTLDMGVGADRRLNRR